MPDEYFQDLLRLFKGLYSGVQVHGRLGMALTKLLLLIFLKNNLAKKIALENGAFRFHTI